MEHEPPFSQGLGLHAPVATESKEFKADEVGCPGRQARLYRYLRVTWSGNQNAVGVFQTGCFHGMVHTIMYNMSQVFPSGRKSTDNTNPHQSNSRGRDTPRYTPYRMYLLPRHRLELRWGQKSSLGSELWACAGMWSITKRERLGNRRSGWG